MNELNEQKINIKTSRSIRNLLKQKWLVVIVALILTGLGAALTGVLFKAGIKSLEVWRLELLQKFPPLLILPILGGLGGFISASLICP